MCDSFKLQMFMISVLWSDEAEVIIYRSFKNFKKLHVSQINNNNNNKNILYALFDYYIVCIVFHAEAAQKEVPSHEPIS